MLSGFLGAGKTTLLRYLLEQNEERIGCIVNDVASINIDAKLLRNDRNKDKNAPNSTSDLADTVELANGCACCSIQDELLSSFEQLLALADQKGITYDRFVLENSGVAEPQNLRDKFTEAVLDGHPVMSRIQMDNMVTVVDSGSFTKDYASRAPLAARPDLGEGGTLRPVVDLLIEQIECADYVLLNKKDMLSETELQSLVEIAHQLNPLAKVEACEQGKVDVKKIFGPEARGVIAHMNTEGQHRGAVAAVKSATARAAKEAEKHGHGHEHGHEHGHADEGHKHDGHEHDGHKHDHNHDGHDHKHNSHGHNHDHEGHNHDHEGGHKHEHEHEHHHHHKHERQETTAAARFGIRSFVYSRRRPFHPQRLRDLVLKWLPVSQNTALEGQAPAAGDSPIKAVIRSKGFIWMSYSHSSAFYWSHAGQHFEIRDEGDWWAYVPDEEWPPHVAQRSVIISDFDLATEYGDRRQEIVFIGAGMDEAAICRQVDLALLSDEEMVKYRERYAADPDPAHPDVKLLQDRSKKQKV